MFGDMSIVLLKHGSGMGKAGLLFAMLYRCSLQGCIRLPNFPGPESSVFCPVSDTAESHALVSDAGGSTSRVGGGGGSIMVVGRGR